jgi:hypothetical protein
MVEWAGGRTVARMSASVKRHLKIWIAVVLVFTYAVVSYLAQGNPAASVRLNDASVWVTRSANGYVARLNHQIAQLDAQVVPGGTSADVVQAGSTVFTVSTGPGQIRAVNVASASLAHPVGMPAGAQVSLGGHTVAIRSGNDVWALPSDGVSNFDVRRPTYAGLGGTGGRLAAVGQDGVVHAFSVSNQVLTNITVQLGGTTSSQSEHLATGAGHPDIVVSAVGSVAVVLNQDAHTVTVAGQSPVSIPTDPVQMSDSGLSDPAAVQIQQPGPAASVVYIASNSGLYAVPLSGGPATKVSGDARVSGDPVPPVFDDGCVHAAWARSANYVYSCSGGIPALYPIRKLAGAGSNLKFRVNGSIVVLNDAVSGQVWVVHNGLHEVDHWAQFEKQLNPGFDKNNPGSGPADNSHSTQPPKANPVAFGVRPGRSSVLPVTLFDSDPNNYVLTLTSPTSLPPSEGTLQIVNNGTEFQYTPAPGMPAGTTIPPFAYTVSDGVGANNTASNIITISVVAPSTESAPKPVSSSPGYSVLQGATIRFNALISWWDAEADPFGLVGASAPVGSGNQVAFDPNGQVTFRAGGAPGAQSVTLQVSDGNQTATSVVPVDVVPIGTPLKPQTTPFLAAATAGQPTALKPLSVDSDPNDYPMTLASVTQDPNAPNSASGTGGLVWNPNYSAGTINFEATTPGIYYLDYVATDSPPQGIGVQSSPTTIRIDVADPTAVGPPVAMDQVAHLAPGGSTLVPVLSGASDPAGNVLVVQSVTPQGGSPVVASVFQGDQVRLSTSSGLSGTQVLSYTISDGVHQATASIDVLPSNPTSTSPLPPVAEPVAAQAVVGDITAINPLANDFDPQGGALKLTPGSVKVNIQASTFPAGAHGVGNAFIDGLFVRYLPPDAPGQAVISYGVTNASGQSADSTITVTVASVQGDTSPPVPVPLTASVIAGSTVTIPVPLAGIDPLGESVTLLGLAPNPIFSDPSFPKRGQITKIGADSLTYQAFPNGLGTDSFFYVVRNKSGLTGVGSIRVGVAPAAPFDEPPVGVPQTVGAPPGQVIVVPVLAHDFDPQGYAIAFGPESELKGGGTNAVMTGSSLQVKVPGSGQATAIYPLTDGHGASATGTLTVVADPNAKQLPIPHDIVVSAITTASAVSVPVNILSHVDNPYGPSDQVSVVGFAGDAAGAPTSLGSGVYSVPLAGQPQVVQYTVSNKDGQASATITVPARQYDAPQTVTPLPSVSTPMNKPITISVGSFVTDPGGKPIRIVTSAEVQAANGTAVTLSATAVTFTPLPGYVGPASLSMAVTDGGAGDTTAPSVVVSLPISVTGSSAPVVFYGPTVTAEIGKPASYSLTQYISSPNPDGVSGVQLSTPNAPPALHAQIGGQTLSVLPQGIANPSPQVVTFTLSQGGGTPVTGQVAILVESSLAPLARTVPQSSSVNQGQAVQIDVLSQDFDPFPTPLVISNVSVLGGPGQGTATTHGSAISFIAAPHFVGLSSILYTVTDQTKLPARQVQGTVAVTVFGVPDPPGAPSVLNYIGNGTVLLSWSAPPDNGKPITRYAVKSNPPSPGCGNSSTTCTVNGLSNGTPYTFTVTATNAVGGGLAGQPSSPVTPNNYPDQPAQPTTVFGDQSVTVRWTPPANLGTPITCYQVQISPPVSPTTGCLPPTTTSYVWSGLTNGSSYSFEVRAQNDLGFGPWSPLSSSMVPAGKPTAPGQPTVAAIPNDPTGDKLAVAWPAATGIAANGDAVDVYTLSVFQGAGPVGAPIAVVPSSATENPITFLASGLTKGKAYSFSVTSHNKAGYSGSSPPGTFTVFGQPDAVTNLSASQHQNGQTQLSFTPPNNNGQAISGYQYSENNGPFVTLAANNVVAGLANGQTYGFAIEACNTYCSAPSNVATAVPDAPPTVPTPGISTSGNTVNFSWSAPQSNGCPIQLASFSVTNGSSGSALASGSGSFTGNPGTTYTISVTATDTCGLSAGPSQASAQTPSPTVSIGRGAPSAACSGCFWVNVNGSNFPTNTSITFTCSDAGGQFWVNPGTNPPYGPFPAWYSTNSAGAFGWAVTTNPGKSCADTAGASVTVTVSAGGATASTTDGNF